MSKIYTEGDVTRMVAVYQKNPTLDTVHTLAVKLRKPKASIIAKLTALGVYRRKIYVNKNGEVPRKKPEILQDLADTLSLDKKQLDGLYKSTKESLVTLEGTLKQFIFELQDEILLLTKKVEEQEGAVILANDLDLLSNFEAT